MKQTILDRIPKKYRQHITAVEVTESNDYNERGQRLRDYLVTWDNGDEHRFQNQEHMLAMIREYTDENGYYIAP